jgi:hypothetical protein
MYYCIKILLFVKRKLLQINIFKISFPLGLENSFPCQKDRLGCLKQEVILTRQRADLVEKEREEHDRKYHR